ncbi:hypothetical protein BCR44DRAFT_1437882 [Catenaria anguillulae PL171]|uniref:Uncharacterized protein n=1 Tax=Catenaria anguillulae PL171 TaxID=765915 RepID=A0A1Y2HI35_9FUNG|nr:hypothetical protein BCR44DRAFT_1437882 [Catenaria anguillulae PL171]
MDNHADSAASTAAVYPVRRLYGTPEHPPAVPESPPSVHAKPQKLTINTAALGIDSSGWSRPCAGLNPGPSPTSPSCMRPPPHISRSLGGQTPPHSPHFPHSPTTLLPSPSASLSCTASQCKRWWVASQCLNNLIRAAVVVYVPLAIASYIVATLHVLGYVEPVSAWSVAVMANSTGFANAYAYFSNEVLKARLRVPVEEVQRRVMADVPERPGRAVGVARGA